MTRDVQDDLLDRGALAVSSSRDIGDILEHLARLALEACPADRCSVFLLDELNSTLVPMTYVARSEISAALARPDFGARPHFREMQPIDLKADPLRWKAFQRGKAFAIPDLSVSPLVPREVVSQFGARSAIVVPLVAPERPMGILALDWMGAEQEFSESGLILAEAIGAYAALAIRHARLFEKLNDKASSLERLVEVAATLNSKLSVRDVLDVAHATFDELLGSIESSFNLLAYCEQIGDNELAEASLRRLTAAESSQFIDYWQNSTEPVVEERVEGRDTLISLCSPFAMSAAAFPIFRGNSVLGFVLAAFAGPSVSPEQLSLGRALVGLAAMAMDRADLYESLKTQLQHAEVLYGLSEAVAGAPDHARVLAQLNRLLGSDIGFELASIHVVSDRLRDVVQANPPRGEELGAIRYWRETLASRSQPRPLAVGDAILVPIVSRNRVLGALRVHPTATPLNSAAEELLIALGTACAEVIQKAAMRRDLAESEHRLAIAAERERIAQDLHNSVGQLITGLGMQLASHAADAPDADWQRRLEDLVDLTAKGSCQMGEAIHALLFLQVRRRGLVHSLRELAQTFEATSGVATGFHVRGRPLRLEPSREDALFRVAHEAFMNIQRHSGTPAVSMTLCYESDEVGLAVRDWGAGFGSRDPFGQEPGHFGLLGTRQRVEEEGGKLLVAEARPQGVVVEARIPLKGRKGIAAHSRRSG